MKILSPYSRLGWFLYGKRRDARDGAVRAAQEDARRHDARLDGRLVTLEHSHTELWVHPPDRCASENCTVHNPSDHSMRSFPQHWRGDRQLMERICPHGVGHPDPDELDLDRNGRGVHGCDGCCTDTEETK